MFRQMPTCFLIASPQDAAATHDIVSEVCREIGVELLSVETASFRSASTGDVAEAIERADFVIADVTGRNPNVFYELGVAYGMRKRILVLNEQSSELPDEMREHRALIYRIEDVKKLKYYLRDWVEETIKEGSLI